MSNEFSELNELSEYAEADVGLNPEDKKHAKSNQLDWFKGKKGVSHRVSFTYFWPLAVSLAIAAKLSAKEAKTPEPSKEDLIDLARKAVAKRAENLGKAVDQLAAYEKLDISQVRFRKILGHYKADFGYVVSRLGLDGPEADTVWKSLGEVKSYFCTTMIVYPTNDEGELDRDNLSKWRIRPWRLGSKSYLAVHGCAQGLVDNDLSIAEQDLIVTCKNDEFQAFEIRPAGKAIWRKSPKMQEAVLKASHVFYDKLKPFREMSTLELRGALGMDAAASGDDIAEADMAALLSNV